MTVLTILAYVAAVGAASAALNGLEYYSVKHHRHRFMTRSAFVLVAAAAVSASFGLELWKEAEATGGDELNGILLMTLGTIAIMARLVWNVRKTNILLGTAGTAVQAGVFGVLTFVGVIFLLLFLFVQFLLLANSRPVYVINR
ncbi:MAG: hypothetical protein OXU20_07010 [Myxococcales bacterium]|nr:hypothetical protein [Myxococcales bacterium]MDD9965632.1 hypothetical protein [Myxococcales bacterium]